MSHDPVQIRALSQVMFGQQYRLELMVAIADDDTGLVCLTDLAAELGITASNIQAPLKSLVRAGLISAMPRGDSRRLFYRRNVSAGWNFARELVTNAGALNVARQQM